MTYIKTGIDQPGIVELLFYKGSTGKALSKLAHTLLHGPSGLTSGERELIAAYVSKLNTCEFCYNSHAATANIHLTQEGKSMPSTLENIEEGSLSDKMKALLNIAKQVQTGGKSVLKEDVERATANGASDEDVHDTVLIAAAFCMYNRYVDGLGTNLANDQEYSEMGIRMAKKGYKYPPLFLRKFVIRMMRKKK